LAAESSAITPNFTRHMSKPISTPTEINPAVRRWVEEQVKLCQPDKIFWCDGSEAEKELLTAEAVEKKNPRPARPEKIARLLLSSFQSE
jgi:GTP-dependent phosphoenolpyruvate carboxykinase